MIQGRLDRGERVEINVPMGDWVGGTRVDWGKYVRKVWMYSIAYLTLQKYKTFGN